MYIGALFLLDLGIVMPTEDRIQNVNLIWEKINNNAQVTASDFLHLLGIIASCLEIVPNAHLYMIPIQLHLLKLWTPETRSMNTAFLVTLDKQTHLIW